METISKEEAAWLAGILDGEGCLQIGIRPEPRETLRLLVEIVNTCPYMIRRVSEIYKKMGLVFCIGFGHWRNDSEYLKIAVSGHGSLEKLLEAVIPHLTTKREQAELIWNFIQWRKTQPYGHPNKMYRVQLALEYRKLREQLVAHHKRRFSLQRLPRRASEVLDISQLEAKV